MNTMNTSNKQDNFKLIANVIMGDRPEPFLPYCLESIKDGIDLVVLNDNSGNPDNPNMVYVKNSTLFKEGKIDIITSDFEKAGGFAGVRNLCLDRVQALIDEGKYTTENLWILYLDCDEVHPPNFKPFVKRFLANVPDSVGIVDGYMYQFILTFDYYTTLERRHNLFFRYHQDIRWERPVHETLIDLKGERIATDYTYPHYGYLLPPEDLMSRWKLYEKYNGLDFDLEKVKKEEMLLEKSDLCIPFTGQHPPCLKEYIEVFKANPFELNKAFMEKINKRRKNPLNVIGSLLRDVNYQVRLKFRRIQAVKYGRLPKTPT
jgi:hypothetical protein